MIYQKGKDVDRSKWGRLAPEKKELLKRESEFAKQHRHDSDEELLEYLRTVAEKLGKCPTLHEVEGFAYIKKRLGPWPRILEKAGLKKINARQLARQERQMTARKPAKGNKVKENSYRNSRMNDPIREQKGDFEHYETKHT